MSQLPPKRFQDYHDSKFDSIRHLPWYYLLEDRRNKIEALKCALDVWLNTDMFTQADAADHFGVDTRELRDYRDFVEGRSRLAEIEPIGTRRAYQMVLDQTYDVFVDTAGRYTLNKIIQQESRLFGVNHRAVIELWEVDPHYYPSHYRGIK